jgi:hypothetical protein
MRAAIVAALVLLALPAPSAAATDPALARTTVVHAAQSSTVLVSLPKALALLSGHLPSQALGATDVTATPIENFVGFTLTSTAQAAGSSQADLPRLVAAALPLPTGPQIKVTMQGNVDGRFARELPVGSYALRVLATGPVEVTIRFPGLDEGQVDLFGSAPATFTRKLELHAATPAGTRTPVFSGGYAHTATADHLAMGYVWVSGDRKAVHEMGTCTEFPVPDVPEAGGVYAPGCGGATPTVGSSEVALTEAYTQLVTRSAPAQTPRAYSVGGYYNVAGVPQGGGVLWLWVDL